MAKDKVKKRLKPLIKYTGGKYNEYKYFGEYIPETVNDYYEPFFGGGGVFFRMHNDELIKGDSYINDISTDLMNFYSCINDVEFINELYNLSDVWDDVISIGDEIVDDYGDLFYNIILKKDEVDVLFTKDFKDYIVEIVNSKTHVSKYNFHGFSFVDEIIKGLTSKIKRFRNKNINENDNEVTPNCIKTSVCQSFYFVIRNMYNEWLLGRTDEYSKIEKSVQWFFIREYCFGSMFRFGKDGRFNIPYGGLSYNTKCIRCKIKEFENEELQRIFKKVRIFSEDFDKFMKRKFNPNDFIFLDPPYDSTFSEYDNNSFTREDHIRLKKRLEQINCKWMLVIRETEFISELYKDYSQIKFNKTYAYQARGKYDDKQSIHLIIKNY